MPKVTAVFTPSDMPSYTYVQRPTHNLEERLRQAFEVPKMIISISGPSKSGKTVLVHKVVERDNLIHLYGATIRTPDDLWSHTLRWMDAPSSRTETSGSSTAVGAEVQGEGKIGMACTRFRRHRVRCF